MLAVVVWGSGLRLFPSVLAFARSIRRFGIEADCRALRAPGLTTSRRNLSTGGACLANEPGPLTSGPFRRARAATESQQSIERQKDRRMLCVGSPFFELVSPREFKEI